MASDWKHQGRVLRNRYHLSDSLVRGGLSCVYRGEDTVLRRSIAVKAVPPEHIESFRAALHDTAALTHPAVVATYDAVEEDHYLFIVQEYVPARPLSAYLRDGIPSERAFDLAGQIARALAYAHAHDVIHGDLTPSAVLIDRQATVRINNFGLPPDREYFDRFASALALSAVQAEGETAHAEPAPAPVAASDDDEQTVLSHDELVGAAPTREEDVRALGLLLWQVLSEPVRQAPAGPERGRQERAFRPDVPPPARELVDRCVVRSHPERISDAETLALAIEALEAELAALRPAASEHTPPALRLAREEVAREAPWSVERTLGTLRPWNSGEEGQQRGRPNAASGPERVQAKPWREVDTPVVSSPPRIQLPSLPIRDEAGVLRATGVPRAGAGAALEIEKPVRWPAQSQPVPAPGTISWALVLLLGVILFLVFFLVGFFGPRILG